MNKVTMTPKAKHPIFLLGRFRSGTTALWQLFNRLPEYTAWYEPLHPNLPTTIQHTRPKASHRGVDDYWHAYRSLPEPLTRYWRRDFSTSRLYMEPEHSWAELKDYIDWLINISGGIPVLQFNRMDLRIGWLRQQYPQSKIITVQRPPYAAWLSCRAHLPDAEKNNESYPDAYELMQWCAALAHDFPFLAPQRGRHGYFRHYALWRMASTMAQEHADQILQLENLATDARTMASELGWSNKDWALASATLAPPESTQFPTPGVIQKIEQHVDSILGDSGLQAGLGRKPLAEIRATHAAAWKQWPADNCTAVTREVLGALYSREDEITRLLSVVRGN